MLPAPVPSSPARRISLLQGQGRKTFLPCTSRESNPTSEPSHGPFPFPTRCLRAGGLCREINKGCGQGYWINRGQAWGIPGGIGMRSGEGDQPQVGKPKGRERAGAAPGKREGAGASQEEQERQERLDLRGCGQGRAPIFGSSPQETFQEEFQGIRSHSTWGCASLLRQETEQEPSEGDGRCPFPRGQR